MTYDALHWRVFLPMHVAHVMPPGSVRFVALIVAAISLPLWFCTVGALVITVDGLQALWAYASRSPSSPPETET